MGGTRLLSLNVRLARAKAAIQIVTYERPLLAESGHKYYGFSAVLMSAMPPKAVIGLE